jgi:hypothetical protein
MRQPQWAMGCRDRYVGQTADVPQKADDLLQCPSRQPWAISQHPCNCRDATKGNVTKRDRSLSIPKRSGIAGKSGLVPKA